jgi:hypothetical protein
MPTLNLVVVRAEKDRGPEIQAAWQQLESRLPSLKGRKFYGVVCREASDTVYFAGLEPADDAEIERLGFKRCVVPGGKYARVKLSNWHEHVDEIGSIVDDLEKTVDADRARPVLEHYRSQSELHLLVLLKSEMLGRSPDSLDTLSKRIW